MFPLQQLLRIKYFEQYFARTVKNRSRRISRLWTDHCEYIIAQRFRRGQQMLYLYRRIWDEQALRRIIQMLRIQLEKHAKGIMFSGVGIASAFDWDSERINYESVRKNFDELELVKRLRQETIYCDTCGHRLIIDTKLENIVYCSCSTGNTCASKAAIKKLTSSSPSQQPYEKDWYPYMERQNMVIWRREQDRGLYAYKVYAMYDDVSAEEFLHVQTDTEYRKIWDKTAISLNIIDTDPVHRNKSHIIYWEMQWPKLFSNRDYVFSRRYFVDRNRKLIIIVNKSIEHPASPKKPNIQRVNDYWSCMVIHSTSQSLKTPGVEYVLTYYDNPGIVLPQSITSWVAQKQLPEFLHKLYIATLDYAAERRRQQVQTHQQKKSFQCKIDYYFRDPGYEYPPEPEISPHIYGKSSDNEQDEDDDDELDDTQRYDNVSNNNPKNDSNNSNSSTSHNLIGHTGEHHTYSPEEDGECSGTKSISWWKYLLPFHYF